MAVPGGVLRNQSSVLLGAVGISGDTSDNDEAAALAVARPALLVKLANTRSAKPKLKPIVMPSQLVHKCPGNVFQYAPIALRGNHQQHKFARLFNGWRHRHRCGNFF